MCRMMLMLVCLLGRAQVCLTTPSGFHAITDPFRHLKGGTPTLPLPLRLPLRAPLWGYGGPIAGLLDLSFLEPNACFCEN